jgi:hypothetical protein
VAPSCLLVVFFVIEETTVADSREPSGFSAPNSDVVLFGLLLASGFLLADFLLRGFLYRFLRYFLLCGFFAFLRHVLSPPFLLIRLTRCAGMSKHLSAAEQKIFRIGALGM